MTQSEFDEMRRQAKERRMLLEKIIIARDHKMKQVLEDMKACVDRAAEKYKLKQNNNESKSN